VEKHSVKRTAPFYTISIIAALVFVVLLPGYHPYPFSFLLKLIPLLSLSVLVFLRKRGKIRILSLFALIFCMIGDVLLDLDRNVYFKLALAAFLTGHLFYIFVFISKGIEIKKRIIPVLGVLAYSFLVGFFLSSIDPNFKIPVFAYLCVISLMTLSACVKRDFSRWIAWGAVIFMISDTVIAVNKFLQPIPYSTVFNISLYFIAQIVIIRGIVKDIR